MLRSKSKVRIWRLEGGVGGALTGSMFGGPYPGPLQRYVHTELVASVSVNSSHSLHCRTQHTEVVPRSLSHHHVLEQCGFFMFGSPVPRCHLDTGHDRREVYNYHYISTYIQLTDSSFSIATFAAFAVSISPIARLSILAALTLMLSIIPVVSFIAPHKVYKSLRWSMRLAQSALGSMGVVYSIAVLAHVPGWEDALDVMWVETRSDSAATLALSIAGWLLFILGVGCDWILYRSLGPSQDQVDSPRTACLLRRSSTSLELGQLPGTLSG
jgi:hypothetical protein